MWMSRRWHSWRTRSACRKTTRRVGRREIASGWKWRRSGSATSSKLSLRTMAVWLRRRELYGRACVTGPDDPQIARRGFEMQMSLGHLHKGPSLLEGAITSRRDRRSSSGTTVAAFPRIKTSKRSNAHRCIAQCTRLARQLAMLTECATAHTRCTGEMITRTRTGTPSDTSATAPLRTLASPPTSKAEQYGWRSGASTLRATEGRDTSSRPAAQQPRTEWVPRRQDGVTPFHRRRRHCPRTAVPPVEGAGPKSAEHPIRAPPRRPS